jgi:hypothetical protein
MAAQCASWAAGQHLNSLTGLATKLERLERQAEVLETWQDDSDNKVCTAYACRALTPHLLPGLRSREVYIHASLLCLVAKSHKQQ